MKNMSFWAQDILKEPQELLNAQSRETLDKIICSDGKNKGLYNTVAEKLMPHLNDAEKRELNRVMAKAESSLNKANETECIKYFDKKRDLTLGSAPTDVVTAVVSVGAAGVALASADNKEKRTSRTITKVIPALAGVGTSIALTAGLVSGFKGIAIGFGSGLALSKIGSFIDKQVFGNNSDETVNKSSLKEKKVYA